MTRRSTALGLACFLVACASSTLSTSGPQFPPREPDCDFEVFTTPPASSYVEIGTLDISRSFFGGTYGDVASLRKGIQSNVCKAGGDAVVAYANGNGQYVKASVLKRVASAPAAPPASPAAAVTPAPSEELGCRYDTQCKGDRVCVSGACVDPVKASADPASPAPTVAP